ncbi:hypothetical protein AGR3A_Cc190128 [Agrobacterium tomkonis CFBP 6623]|uniref:Uncharacterized protein n=1 Tax=Agrobacterium tomkonis CFBP 6623 TaxID=1183432 RepID=A0A1S7P1W1_9HYPH|nr:hypothetical protein AGR3A_Cc190128 [Agrobacterium tomkonis CFBP 6623]
MLQARALSRNRTKYVQYRIREYGVELFRWLEEGAYFYVCCDASRMAKDVDSVLREVISSHGKMSNSGVEDYVKTLLATKRYVRDVY